MAETHDLGKVFVQYARMPTGAPRFQRGVTRETEGEYRVDQSFVIKLPLARESHWFGLRLSWLSLQIKLPFGRRMAKSRHGLVFGRWVDKVNDEWSALLLAIRLGREPEDGELRNYEEPGEDVHRQTELIPRFRVDSLDDAGAGQ